MKAGNCPAGLLLLFMQEEETLNIGGKGHYTAKTGIQPAFAH
jgi:hypothetical protein